MAVRFMWMDLPAGSSLPSRRSARSDQSESVFCAVRSSGLWTSRSLQSRARTNFTAVQSAGITSALNSGNPLLNAFNSPGSRSRRSRLSHDFVWGNITGLWRKCVVTVSGSHRSIQDNSLVSATILNPNSGVHTLTCGGADLLQLFRCQSPAKSRTDITANRSCAGERNTLVTRFHTSRTIRTMLVLAGWCCLMRGILQALP